MNKLRAITVLFVIVSLCPTAVTGQKGKRHRKRRRLPAPTIILKAGGISADGEPYLSKTEAACPKFCAILTTDQTGEIEPKNGVYEVSSEQRLSLKVLLKTARVEDQYEDLSIAGITANKTPEPTLTLLVTKLVDGNRVTIPVKVSSPGGGKDLTVYRLHLNLAIPYPEEIRSKRVSEFAEYWIKYMEEQSAKEGKPMPRPANERENLANYLNEVIVDNQPGDYEINIDYRSKGKAVWNGVHTAPTLRLRILEGEPLKPYLPKE